MAANRFATVLHRNTHRMAFLLIYTVLEWILITLLLLNALFSYLIFKFAFFFGLKPPCVFCTRLDHIFEPSGERSFYRDLLCHSHAEEISKIKFCSKHRRLSEEGDLCEDCASFVLGETDRNAALFSWMKRSEKEEKDLLCSCCGVVLESGFYSSSVLKTEPWDVLECAQKDRSVKQMVEGAKHGIFGSEKVVLCREIPSTYCEDIEEQKVEGEVEGDSKIDLLLPSFCAVVEDVSAELLTGPFEKMAVEERLLPINLIDSLTFMRFCSGGPVAADIMLQSDSAGIAEKQTFIVSSDNSEERNPKANIVVSAILEPSEFVSFECSSIVTQKPVDSQPVPMKTVNDLEQQQRAAVEEESKVNEDANCEISIGSDICDQEQIEYPQMHESLPEPKFQSYQNSESFAETIDRETVETEPLKRTARLASHLAISSVLNDILEEGMPETPTTPYSIEGLPILPKRLLLERRESGTESLDGSIASDLDNIESLTLDRLKAVLKAERKSLTALYAELEEERSASAIAANQTMAMITRLQEEKAAMQMEALQYQRMMEEQSEYDQEALQLLNDLMMRKDKEKQELEKELELYHEKICMYEARERRKKIRIKEKGSKSTNDLGFTSSEESDNLSIESHEGEESNHSLHERNKNTPFASGYSYVENKDSFDGYLSEFEENRLSILKQLKALVEKLFEMDDEDENSDPEIVEHSFVENGHGVNGQCKLVGDDINYNSAYLFSHDQQTNGNFHRKQSTSIQGKSLLPLFDAVSLESEENLFIKHDSADGTSPGPVAKVKVGRKKLAIPEEVDQAFKRLQALEADCDFIKHCISSLKKGDKGMNLLHDILQNLHDLRRVDLHARNSNSDLN